MVGWGLSLLIDTEDERHDCIVRHEICVDTTDGWMPYPSISKAD